MDSLKFAFDTLIIGALALPWLWPFMRIFFQRSNGQDVKFPIISALSDSTKHMVGGVLILALGYFPGSAVSRISSDFSMMPKSCTDCPRRPRFVRAFIFTSIATMILLGSGGLSCALPMIAPAFSATPAYRPQS